MPEPAHSGSLLNLGCGQYPLPGFVNLDKTTGWRFEDGLGDYGDGSVAGITISHALMYVPLEAWPAVFAEFARVLRCGGVLRITEDSTGDPESERYGGHHDAVTLTTFELVAAHLLEPEWEVFRASPKWTLWPDGSLIQAHHGPPPKVFHLEALRSCST